MQDTENDGEAGVGGGGGGGGEEGEEEEAVVIVEEEDDDDEEEETKNENMFERKRTCYRHDDNYFSFFNWLMAMVVVHSCAPTVVVVSINKENKQA